MHSVLYHDKCGENDFKKGLVSLSELFRHFFPDVTYSSAVAKCRLLHLPLAALTISLSSTAARKQCGWENMGEHSATVEKYKKMPLKS